MNEQTRSNAGFSLEQNMSETTPGSLANAVDKALLEIIDKGVSVQDGNGGIVTITAPAAYLKVAVDRLRQIGDCDPALPGSSQEELIKRSRRVQQRLKLAGGPAPIDIEEVERRA